MRLRALSSTDATPRLRGTLHFARARAKAKALPARLAHALCADAKTSGEAPSLYGSNTRAIQRAGNQRMLGRSENRTMPRPVYLSRRKEISPVTNYCNRRNWVRVGGSPRRVFVTSSRMTHASLFLNESLAGNRLRSRPDEACSVEFRI